MKRIASFIVDKVFDGLLLGKPELWDGFGAQVLRPEDVDLLSALMEKSGCGFGSEMSLFAEQLIQQYGGQPIRILGLYNGISTEGYELETPTTQVSTRLFSQRSAWQPIDDEASRVNVCDSHLHGGLAIDVRSLFLSLVHRADPINVIGYGKVLTKVGPVTVNVPLSLAVSRWATWMFVSLVRSDWSMPSWCEEFPLHSQFFQWIRKGIFWTNVRLACFSTTTDAFLPTNDLYEQLLHLDVTFPQELDNNTDPSGALFQVVKSNPNWMSDVVSWQNQYILGLVRFCTMLFGAGVANHGDGLDGFQNRVENCSSLKKIILKNAKGSPGGISKIALTNKRELYQTSFREARDSFSYPYSFGGCEFRQNLHENLCSDRDVGTILNEIYDSISPAWHAFYDYLKCCENSSFRFCTPLAFQRIPSQGYVSRGNVSDAKPGFEFKEAVVTANAILQFYNTIGADFFNPLIGSVDVSGVETWSQNWPYVATINWLKDQVGPDLNFTIHSGESFPYRMRGLRMIGECFLGEQPPDRVGHALALSERTSFSIEERNKKLPVPKRELVSDLCWFHHVHDSGIKCSCLKLISKLTIAHNPMASLDARAWVEAFNLLHQSTLVDKVVSRVPPISGSDFWNVLFNETLWLTSESRWKVESQVFQAACLLVWGSIQEYGALDCDLDRPAEPDTYKLVREYMDGNLAQAERFVKGMLREHHTVLEVCPTSNLKLSGLYRYQDHPLWDWIDDGLSISINSDDPLVFVSFAGDELRRLERYCGGSGRGKLKEVLKLLAFGGHCQRSRMKSSDVKRLLGCLNNYFESNGFVTLNMGVN